MGVAVIDLDQMTMNVFYIEGSPHYQIQELAESLEEDSIIIVEDFSYFSAKNPVTTATLNQRFGYIYWRLAESYTVHKYNVNTVRKHLKIHSRIKGEQKKKVNEDIRMACQIKFTSDETDAIALLLFHQQEEISDLANYRISKMKRHKEPDATLS